MMAERKRIVVGVTGASGAVYAKRLIECLERAGVDLHLIVSPWGRRLFRDELGIVRIDASSLTSRTDSRLTVHPYHDLSSPLSSGTFLTDGMIICPCSSNTLGRLAAGVGDGLITRAAAVTLKERRRLVIVPREMPTSRIDLRNMLTLDEAGAVICPACPGFYMQPLSLDDLVDFVVGKLLDLIQLPHDLYARWGGTAPVAAAARDTDAI